MIWLGEKNEFFAFCAAPAGRNRDAIFFVDGMSKFAGVESLRLRIGIHTPVENWAILIHFPPLLTTFRASGQ